MTDSEAEPTEATTSTDSPDTTGTAPDAPEVPDVHGQRGEFDGQRGEFGDEHPPTEEVRNDDESATRTSSGESGAVIQESLAPSDAFGALGNEVRTTVLRELAAAEQQDDVRTFSELFEATETDTTAGFAYHLRQLDDHYVSETDEEYRLTYAGRKVARAIEGGTYTDTVDRERVPVADPCPFCATEALELRTVDNYTSVACGDCERILLTLPFPPGGHRSHDDSELPRAFDRHNRHRIALMTDGVCPECGAAVERTVERPPEQIREGLLDESGDRVHDESGDRVRLELSCESCGHRMRCPVTLSVLAHPAVVAFYRDHGEDVRERPLWNVGAEWRECVVSTDPWCVRVSTRLDDEVLDLFLSADGTVVATRRSDVDSS